jgi:hypothetical protein
MFVLTVPDVARAGYLLCALSALIRIPKYALRESSDFKC